jgi:hypothetical protein
MTIRRPARSRWEIAGGYGAEFVDTEDGGTFRWGRVELDDADSFGTKSGSLLLAHKRVCRQRTFSCRKIRRTWLRATWMPFLRAMAVSASSVHSTSPLGSSTCNSPVGS